MYDGGMTTTQTQNVYLPPSGCSGYLTDMHDPTTLTHDYECSIHDEPTLVATGRYSDGTVVL